ncbi:LamG-like jellyroll fold domain-containing protein [Fibrobacter sp.]|uniref:LamG-like jellyroll fold domain-containing protein n=1 Tax=Fibrobacter sp. TaxID=35828 RepID=UPI003890F7B0
MKKYILLILAVYAVCSWASVEPMNSSIYLLLYDKFQDNSSENPYLTSGFYDYLKNQVVADEGYVYCYGVNVSSQSPNKLSSLLVNRDANSVYAKALEDWFSKSSDKNLLAWKKNHSGAKFVDLLKDRVDIVPLRFVVIAEGVSGLVVREYIQGANYQGDFAKVLFFDTPHSGTGYADQTLFQNSSDYSLKAPNASSLGALVPMALLAYYFDGGDAFRNMVISLSENAILGMASNLGAVEGAFKGESSKLFKEYGENSEALWYLAQDADYTDSKYKDLIAKAESVGKDVSSNIGGTQWLNSTGMNTDFSQPLYSIAYSYGFPAIGNGRRTYPDFMNQIKNHVSKEKIKTAIKDSLKSTLEKVGVTKDALETEVSNLANELVNGVVSDEAKKFASEMVAKYGNLKNVLNSENLGNYVQGFSELMKMDMNIDNLSDVIKLFKILEKFIPEKYKSQLFSALMDNFSPEVVEAAKCSFSGSVSECVQKGLTVSATNLANYGVNFFDEGTFDVPSYSAFGEGVDAFRGSMREGFNLAEIVTKDKYPELYEYKELLGDVGKLEVAREDADIALSLVCTAITVSPYKEICKAAAFATNVVMIGDLSLKTSKLAGKIESLKDSRYMSLAASSSPKKEPYVYSYVMPKEGSGSSAISISYSALDAMVFEKPEIAIASVRRAGVVDSVVPLMLYGTCNGDVYDYESLEKNCKIPDEKGNEEQSDPLFETSIPVNELVKSKVGTLSILDNIIRSAEKETPVKEQNYWKWKKFNPTDYLREYRFVINDFQPDSLHRIEIDFNSRTQFLLERQGSSWNVYHSIGYGDWEYYGLLNEPPVEKNGLFVLRPQKLLDLDKNKGLVHNLSEVQSEGPNVVRVIVTNKIGLTTSVDFSYYFMSTKSLVEEGWPKSFDILSQLKQVYITYHNLFNPQVVTTAKVKLSSFGKSSTILGEVEGVISSDNGRYKISADLSSMSLEQSGNYTLEWTIYETDSEGKVNEISFNSIVYIDCEAPKLAIVVDTKKTGEHVLKGNITDGLWGTIKNDSLENNRAIRAMREFLVYDGTTDTLEIGSVSNTNDHYIDFSWGTNLPSRQGKAALVVQAYDYAVPSAKMDSLLTVFDADTSKTLWNSGLNVDSLLNEGLNDTTVSTTIWIDGNAPEIANGKLKMSVAKRVNLDDRPAFVSSMQDVHLGSDDTLKIDFKVTEQLYGRDSSIVLAQIFFNGSSNESYQSYVREAIVKYDSAWVNFVEPEGDRLLDGVYQVVVELTDDAGNISKDTICDRLVVDRTAPVVVELMNGDISFASVSEISLAKAYVSQMGDVASNRSDLKCAYKISVDGKQDSWSNFINETNSKNGKDKVPLEFSIMDKAGGLLNGRWSIRLGCYDAVGNYGENVNFFGVGKRYPRFTYPFDGDGDWFGGEVLIEGTTPNPIFENANDNNAWFKIEWKEESSSEEEYESNGYDRVRYLTKSISDEAKPLAIWDTKGLDSNATYDIRLTVYGCDNNRAKCDTSIVVQKVSLHENIDDDGNRLVLPTLVLVNKSNLKSQIPGDKNTEIQLKLEDGDTSKWSLDVSIEVQSPKNPSEYVVGKNAFYKTVSSSPFEGAPNTLKDGLNVWQDKITGLWNVYWKGAAEAASNSTNPYLVLKYSENALNFATSSDAHGIVEETIPMKPIDLKMYVIPGYDAVQKWMLTGDDVHLQFKTDSAFIVDVSTVDSAYVTDFTAIDSLHYKKRIFCGPLSVHADDVIASAYNSSMLFVNPEQYLVKIKWDGLTETGLYPGGSDVVLRAFAYQKDDKSRLVSIEERWVLATGKLEILKGENATEKLYVNLGAEDSSKTLIKADFGFDFGIAGQAAEVSAKIYHEGNLVKKLMTKQPLLAGSSNSAYSVTWDGTSDAEFASVEEGLYTLEIIAQSADQEDTLTYDFEVLYPDNLVEAPIVASKKGEYPAKLQMDEAFVDENGDYRYVSKPDYLLEAMLSAKELPEDQRKFEFEWTMNGSQHPFFYKNNRFSLGIRRHRKEFRVVVGVLLAARGLDVYQWDTGNDGISYMIGLYPVLFKEGEKKELTLDFDPEHEVVFYDLWTSGGKEKHAYMPVGMQIKVFDYNSLVQKNGNIDFSKNYVVDGDIGTTTWYSAADNDGLWPLEGVESKKWDKNLLNWFRDFNQSKVYWSSSQKNFNNDPPPVLVNFINDKFEGKNCISSTTFDANGNEDFVCKMDEYDAHVNMFKEVKITPLPGKANFGYGNYSCWDEYDECNPFTPWTWGDCGCDDEHHGANKKLGMVLSFDVDDKYWTPTFGMNNLANVYTRFDPTNIALYGNDGCLAKIPEYQNSYSPDSGWVHNHEKEKYITAFEAQKLPVICGETSPLLFNDEMGDGSTYSASMFEALFFNNPDTAYKDVKYRLYAYKEITNGYLGVLNFDSPEMTKQSSFFANPKDIHFAVAPLVTPAVGASSNVNLTTNYPFKESLEGYEAIETEVNQYCEQYAFKCRFYRGLPSRLHLSVGDWDDEYWSRAFVTDDGYMVNPVVNNWPFLNLRRSHINESLDKPDKFAGAQFYDVKFDDVNANGEWQIPDSVLAKPVTDKSSISGFEAYNPTGDPVPVVKTGGWSTPVMDEHGKWLVTNAGKDTTSIVSYILSKDKQSTFRKESREDAISIEDIRRQNLDHGILGNSYTQNISIDVCGIYERSKDGNGVRLDVNNMKVTHPYFSTHVDVDHKKCKVERLDGLDYTRREPEIATLRGRVPSDSMAWNLMYTKNGLLFPLSSGIQDTVPQKTPYPVLDYVDLNTLQGNTSFFLTYGDNGISYFRQLNVHIGDLVKKDSNVIVQSMYGNVSVAFEPGAWGEDDVDVTVRTIPKKDEKSFTSFKNMEIVGPVIEVLPSHDFSNEDRSLWPEISVTIYKDDIPEGTDPRELKVYKPNHETNEIEPLENQSLMAYDAENNPVSDLENDDTWVKIKIHAKTWSFSTFVVMDSNVAKNIEPNENPVVEDSSLICTEYVEESVWAGTDNGWLEYTYPCTGKSNHLLQLLDDGNVVAEHQGVSADTIVWNLKNSGIHTKKDSYSSKIFFYGVDGKKEQFSGPTVYIDSIAPEIDDIEVVIKDEKTSKVVVIEPFMSDVGSGIAKTRYDLYFGGNLIQSTTIFGNEVFVVMDTLDRKVLNSCIGCKAQVSVTTEDFGHNHAKATFTTSPLYPYPSSLVLWYPLSEGVGRYAQEMLGSGMDLDLSTIKNPWYNGKHVYLRKDDYAVPAITLPKADSASPISIEMNVSAGFAMGAVLSWSGLANWTIGIDDDRNYYIKNSYGKTTFAAKATPKVREHVVISIDGKKASIYKNGDLEDSKTLQGSVLWNGAGKPRLGKIGSVSSMNGYIDNLRIYGSALTADEVSGIYRDNIGFDADEIIVTRAVTLPHEGMVIDQSCGVAGKAFLRQKDASVSSGSMTWSVDVEAGDYSVYLLKMTPANEDGFVQILVNGNSYGIVKTKSSGLWESERLLDVNVSLPSGLSEITLRPMGNMGVAAIALANANDLPAEAINYGANDWENLAPQVSVMMSYNSPDDKTWMRAQFQIRNLTEGRINDIRLRYYYKGEGDNVVSQVFSPWNAYMSVLPDAGDVYYGEFKLNQPISSYETLYGIPFFGLFRLPNNEPWEISDDPSYIEGARNGYVETHGVAVLDEDGNLLNDWACFDNDVPVFTTKKDARVLASDEKFGSDRASVIKLVVENTGKVLLNGFEVRYYFRDASDTMQVSVHDSLGARVDMVHAGGNLYYISAMYPQTRLSPGESVAYGNGVKFELHYPSWSQGFDASDDPSHYNITGWDLVEADSVVLLDLNGNLLWGNVPKPVFSNDYIIEPFEKSMIHREGDVIYVDVESEGRYTLETVNAAGMPLNVLFNGNWNEGEHVVDVSNYNISSGSYLVLRKDKKILYWNLFK